MYCKLIATEFKDMSSINVMIDQFDKENILMSTYVFEQIINHYCCQIDLRIKFRYDASLGNAIVFEDVEPYKKGMQNITSFSSLMNGISHKGVNNELFEKDICGKIIRIRNLPYPLYDNIEGNMTLRYIAGEEKSHVYPVELDIRYDRHFGGKGSEFSKLKTTGEDIKKEKIEKSLEITNKIDILEPQEDLFLTL